MSRFHRLCTVLLACLILGAGSQAAFCDLACGLESGGSCHGSATASSQTGGMADMHCAGMMRATTVPSNVKLDGHAVLSNHGPCERTAQMAFLSAATHDDGFAAIHWVLVEAVVSQRTAAAYRFRASAKSPPLRSPVDPLLVSLRV